MEFLDFKGLEEYDTKIKEYIANCSDSGAESGNSNIFYIKPNFTNDQIKEVLSQTTSFVDNNEPFLLYYSCNENYETGTGDGTIKIKPTYICTKSYSYVSGDPDFDDPVDTYVYIFNVTYKRLRAKTMKLAEKIIELTYTKDRVSGATDLKKDVHEYETEFKVSELESRVTTLESNV